MWRSSRAVEPSMSPIAHRSVLAAIEAGDVMAPGLVACPPGAALTEVATLMAPPVHAVVVDLAAPRLITARDVVRAVLAGATRAAEADRRRDATRCSLHDPLQAVARRMVGDVVAHVWAFVTDMDVVAGALRSGPVPTAGAMASIGLAVVRFDATLELAASVVAESRAGHVVAVDGEGFPVGVVSTLDLVGVIAAGA